MSYYLQTQLFFKTPFISSKPNDRLGIVVVIPCYNEIDLIKALSSLKNCDKPTCFVEVVTVINSAQSEIESVKQINTKMLKSASEWALKNNQDWINFYFIDAANLPDKDAGVGLARKIGMDEAVIRFEQLNKDGNIACFDADSTCQTNYLVEIEKHFIQYPKSPACSIHFEHPLNGNEFSKENYEAIEAYELHLRYYKNALKFCGFPYAFHTIGSSMAVKNKAYQKQGGMNKRKAGEDFYFLQKMMTLGNFTELTTTTIFPSPRVSDRVPFGTGRAMQNYINQGASVYNTYHFQSFIDLKILVDSLDELYTKEIELSQSVNDYLNTINFKENLNKIKKNSTSLTHFKQLFFNWFNAFKVLKFVHFARDNYYLDSSVFVEANKLVKQFNLSVCNENEQINELLYFYKELDRKMSC